MFSIIGIKVVLRAYDLVDCNRVKSHTIDIYYHIKLESYLVVVHMLVYRANIL